MQNKDSLDDYIYNPDLHRDSIATVNKDGSRNWIYPKKPKGAWTSARKLVSYFLLALLFGLPYIMVNGKPLFLFNILERRFIFLGIEYYPQDFYLFVFMMLTFLVFIILFTLIFGRLYCGWACPQTIFMEMVFRRIEYWTEGDYTAQIKLDKAPWDATKIRKKGLKHALFLLVSFVIAHTFLSYVIGYKSLATMMREGIGAHTSLFLGLVIFTLVFYGVFAFLREQVCSTICPYGRLQGVLLDRNSIQIVYDYLRGEPRSKISRNETLATLNTSPKGDCVDCGLCVKVCPTGIDIRNGTQLECVNCTACIDVCDEVMVKTNRPLGLIRYDSLEGLVNGRTNFLNPRTYIYSTALGILILLNVVLLSRRTVIDTLFLRTQGTTYTIDSNQFIVNYFTIKAFNKSDQPINIDVRTNEPNAKIILIGDHAHKINPGDHYNTAMMISIPKTQLSTHTKDIELILDYGSVKEEKVITFMGPYK